MQASPGSDRGWASGRMVGDIAAAPFYELQGTAGAAWPARELGTHPTYSQITKNRDPAMGLQNLHTRLISWELEEDGFSPGIAATAACSVPWGKESPVAGKGTLYTASHRPARGAPWGHGSASMVIRTVPLMGRPTTTCAN